METSQALAALPHGPEFRFIDSLTELDPGKSGVGRFTLHDEAEFLRGHFPGLPIMPGVLMIEAIAQLAGTIAQSDPAHHPLRNLRLTAVRNAKIKGTFGPGQTITLQAQITGRMGGLIQAEGQIHTADGQELLTASVVLSGDVSE